MATENIDRLRYWLFQTAKPTVARVGESRELHIYLYTSIIQLN